MVSDGGGGGEVVDRFDDPGVGEDDLVEAGRSSEQRERAGRVAIAEADQAGDMRCCVPELGGGCDQVGLRAEEAGVIGKED